jgi:drug/metabolite transporter (DMT)-like permease
MMRHWIGIFQVVLAGIGFGFLGIFGRWAFSHDLSIGELLFWRFFLAAILMWSYALVFNRKLIFIKPGQILTSIFLGFFGYAVFSTLYFEAIKGISVALAAILLFTFPIFVSLGAHFVLGDKLSRLQWLCLGVASIGLIILLWGDLEVQSVKAIVSGLAAAITYSIYVLISGRVQQNVNSVASSMYVISAAAAGLYIYHQPPLTKILSFNLNQLGIILGISILSSIMPLTLFLAGLQKMKSAEASILVMLEPVVATLAAWLIFNETISQVQSIGAVMVFAALITNSLSHSRVGITSSNS